MLYLGMRVVEVHRPMASPFVLVARWTTSMPLRRERSSASLDFNSYAWLQYYTLQISTGMQKSASRPIVHEECASGRESVQEQTGELFRAAGVACAQVYYFSKFSVKPANKSFSTVKNDYQINFENRWEVAALCLKRHAEQALSQLEYGRHAVAVS